MSKHKQGGGAEGDGVAQPTKTPRGPSELTFKEIFFQLGVLMALKFRAVAKQLLCFASARYREFHQPWTNFTLSYWCGEHCIYISCINLDYMPIYYAMYG